MNVDGRFLDETEGAATPEDLSRVLGVPVSVFDGDWAGVMNAL